MLRTFDIKCMPRTVIKGQVLANLVAKFTEGAEGDERLGPNVLLVSTSTPTSWKVYTNSTANQKGSGVGIILVSPEKIVMEKSLRLGFRWQWLVSLEEKLQKFIWTQDWWSGKSMEN